MKSISRQKVSSALLKFLVWVAAGLTFFALLFIILYILVKGVPHIKPSLFAWTYTTENVSLLPAAINTIIMVVLALAIAVPLGVFCAIYLVEYSRSTNPLLPAIRMTTQTLSGIPSIVYGLFGMLFFVNGLGWGYSLLSGVFTVAIMILPLIIRTTEEALMAVPREFREGSYALGAGRLRTVFRIVLPAASSGMVSGIILAIGRIVGESAALIYTSGTVAQVPENLMGSGRTLAVHMYALSSEGLYTDQSYATAVVLLVIVIGINFLADYLAKKIKKV